MAFTIARVVTALSCASLALACGDDGPRTSETETGFVSASATAATTQVDTTAATTQATETTATSTAPATTAASTSTSSSSSGCQGSCFDVGAPDMGSLCDDDDLEFSFIWIANSPEGTVSKIDTRTREEVGRYVTGPPGSVNPSRTSVGLHGDVAVTNRQGGISKIAARLADCVDLNDNGQIETSTGPDDVLPWTKDECVLWNTQLPTASRPAAWTTGDPVGEDNCGNPVYENAQIWTSAPQGPNGAIVYLLDGETGQIDEMVNVTAGNIGDPFGIYGGAVDANNDFWGITHTVGPLVHVPFDDLQAWETIPIPEDGGFYDGAYGITVDAVGRVWVGGWDGDIHRYEPDSETWTTVAVPEEYGALTRGMMVDANGQLWAAAKSKGDGNMLGEDRGIVHIDTDTATWVELLGPETLDGVQEPAGVSVDFDGLVWMVDTLSNRAWIYDPENATVEWVDGLNSPYTYSDMTGWALKNAQGPNG